MGCHLCFRGPNYRDLEADLGVGCGVARYDLSVVYCDLDSGKSGFEMMLQEYVKQQWDRLPKREAELIFAL